jgi:signal transduction histidine kinase
LAGTFNDMAARLEELVDAQARFVADASHQLRSPLTALRLRLENLPEGPDAEAAVREVQRLARIVDGLLTLSRAEGNRPERRAMDAIAVIEDRYAAWLPLAEERLVTLRFTDFGAPPLSAWLVPGHLEQILDNLLANALDVAPSGSAVTITAASAAGSVVPSDPGPASEPGEAMTGPGDETRRVQVTVADEGPGMSDTDRQQAFVRFWRGASDRTGSGAGLGLAIVAQLVRACGGHISLEPRSGPGLVAVVDLSPAPVPKPVPLNAVQTGL